VVQRGWNNLTYNKYLFPHHAYNEATACQVNLISRKVNFCSESSERDSEYTKTISNERIKSKVNSQFTTLTKVKNKPNQQLPLQNCSKKLIQWAYDYNTHITNLSKHIWVSTQLFLSIKFDQIYPGKFENAAKTIHLFPYN